MMRVVVIYVAATLLINFLMGAFDVRPQLSYQSRYFANSIVYPLLILFLFSAYKILKRSGISAISKILSSGRVRRANDIADLVNRQLFKFSKRSFIRLSILSLFLTMCLAVYVKEYYNTPINFLFVVQSLQALPVWALSLLILKIVVITYMALRKHFTKNQRLQLFEVERLISVNEFVFTLIGIYCGAIAIFSINAGFVELPLYEIVFLILGFLTCLGLAFLPAMTLINNLKKEKDEELHAINQAIAFHLQDINLEPNKKRLVDDASKLSYVSDLFTVRKNISNTSVLPIKFPIFVRLMLWLILPVLTWFAAGMVNNLFK